MVIPWFGQVQNLPTPRCGVPTDESCTQLLSSDPMINLNTTVFFFPLIFSRLRGISTTWSLSPLQKMFTKKHGVREGRATHTRHKIRATTSTQVAIRALNTTRRVHNSNRALVALTKNQMRGIEVLVL